MADPVLVEDVGGVTRILLNRPERLNAVNAELVEALATALEDAAGAGDVRAVVLAGNGRAFCAGYDLTEDESELPEADLRRRFQRVQDVTRAARRAPFPVIAAVHGYALGAGCEIALAADLVVAASDAALGFPEVEVGLSVTGGATHLLPAAVGPWRAKELLLLGERFDAARAHELGLVNRVVDQGQAQDTALAIARELTGKPALSVTLAKQAVDAGVASDLEAACGLEIEHVLRCVGSSAARRAAEGFRDRERRGP